MISKLVSIIFLLISAVSGLENGKANRIGPEVMEKLKSITNISDLIDFVMNTLNVSRSTAQIMLGPLSRPIGRRHSDKILLFLFFFKIR